MGTWHTWGSCVRVCTQRCFQGLLDSVPRHCRGKPTEIQPGCHGAGNPQSLHHQHTAGGQGKEPALGVRAWGVLGVKKGEQRINLLPAESQASSSSLCVPSWSYPEGFGGASAPWNSLLLCCPPLNSHCSGSSELGACGDRRKREGWAAMWSLPSELREITTVPSICSTGFQQQGDHFEH